MGYTYIVFLSIWGWVKSFDTLNEGVIHIHQSQLSFMFTEHRSWLRHMVPGKHCWLTGINRKLSQNQMAHRWDPELQLGLMFIPPNVWQYKIGFHPYPNGSSSTWGTSNDVFRPIQSRVDVFVAQFTRVTCTGCFVPSISKGAWRVMSTWHLQLVAPGKMPVQMIGCKENQDV